MLEERFHEEMVETYKTAKKECKYTASYFIQMVSEMGGLKAAKHLIMKEEPSDGFIRLFEKNRLDLTAEAKALKKEYQELFEKEELEAARKRLEAYGHKVED